MPLWKLPHDGVPQPDAAVCLGQVLTNIAEVGTAAREELALARGEGE